MQVNANTEPSYVPIHEYNLEGGVRVRDKTAGLARAVFSPEDSKKYRAKCYHCFIDNRRVFDAVGRNLVYHNSQTITFKAKENGLVKITEVGEDGKTVAYVNAQGVPSFPGCDEVIYRISERLLSTIRMFLSSKESAEHSLAPVKASAQYIFPSYKDERTDVRREFVIYSTFIPREITRDEARKKAAVILNNTTDFVPVAAGYNRYGVALYVLDKKKDYNCLYWAGPDDESVEKFERNFTMDMWGQYGIITAPGANINFTNPIEYNPGIGNWAERKKNPHPVDALFLNFEKAESLLPN